MHHGSAGDLGERGGRGTAGRPPPERPRRPRPEHPLVPAQRMGHLGRYRDRCWRRPMPSSRNSSSANRTALTRRSSSLSTAPAAICPAIATTCMGQALGVGAVLLAAGAEGKWSALPRAWVVLHQPAAQGQGPYPSSSGRPTRRSGSAPRSNVLTVDSGQRIDRLRAGTDHDRVLMVRPAQQ